LGGDGRREESWHSGANSRGVYAPPSPPRKAGILNSVGRIDFFAACSFAPPMCLAHARVRLQRNCLDKENRRFRPGRLSEREA